MEEKAPRQHAGPEARLLALWHGISVQAKAAFFACFLAGYLTHLYVFTNLIPNSDGIRRLYDTQQGTISGRWFLHYASCLNRFLEAPALIGFLSVLLMALTAAVVVRVLRMESPLLCAAVGVVLVVFPSVAYTYLYTFTASAYFAALLLAAAGVWLTQRYRWGFLVAGVLLAFSLGIYQSYLAAAIALSVLAVLVYTVKERTGVKEVFFQGLRHIGFLILGLVLYLVILKIMLAVKDLELISYLGMDSTMSGYPVAELPDIIRTACEEFWDYLFTPRKVSPYTTRTTVTLNVILTLGALILLVRRVVLDQLYRKPGKLVLMAVLIALMPLACHFTRVINPNTGSTPITRYAFVFYYVLLLVVADWNMEEGKLWLRGTRTVFALALALTVLSSMQIDNTVYSSSETANRASESFCTRLVERVESLEGYEEGMTVYLIGPMPDSVYYSQVEGYTLVEHYSCLSSTVLPMTKHVYDYLNDWLNVQWQRPPEEELKAVSGSEEFQNMALYPSDGSVKMVDGAVVVKLASSYTPMQEYEVQYESRR